MLSINTSLMNCPGLKFCLGIFPPFPEGLNNNTNYPNPHTHTGTYYDTRRQHSSLPSAEYSATSKA